MYIYIYIYIYTHVLLYCHTTRWPPLKNNSKKLILILSYIIHLFIQSCLFFRLLNKYFLWIIGVRYSILSYLLLLVPLSDVQYSPKSTSAVSVRAATNLYCHTKQELEFYLRVPYFLSLETVRRDSELSVTCEANSSLSYKTITVRRIKIGQRI
jgi:hypothetical protein